jgi:hypothetical protein
MEHLCDWKSCRLKVRKVLLLQIILRREKDILDQLRQSYKAAFLSKVGTITFIVFFLYGSKSVSGHSQQLKLVTLAQQNLFCSFGG